MNDCPYCISRPRPHYPRRSALYRGVVSTDPQRDRRIETVKLAAALAFTLAVAVLLIFVI